MDLLYLIKGIIVGAAIAFPVGPIGILCLRRLLIQGPLMGIASGFGAATADVVFASAALLGLGFFSAYVMKAAFLIRLLSSFVLILLGVAIFYAKPPHAIPSKRPHNLLESYFSTFLLTMANPIIILSLFFLIGAMGIDQELDTYGEIFLTAGGVFIGSALWWLILGMIAAYVHPKIHPNTFTRINKMSGIGIAFFGILSLVILAFRSVFHSH